MPQLIDELRAGGCRVAMPHFVPPRHEQSWVELTHQVSAMLRDPALPVLLIDNVADYYYVASDQEYWDLAVHFPNLAPPYQQFWVEHRLPRTIHSAMAGDTDMTQWIINGRVGALVTAIKPTDATGEGLPAEAKWILWCELFIDYGRRDRQVTATGPHGSIFVCVDEHGALVGRPWMQAFAGETEAHLMKLHIDMLYPTFLAVSFLHCKNVRLDENLVDKPLAKKWHAKHGTWPTKYSTLVIEPLKQILRREGKSDQVGIAKAMHICRGHFKDYREGRGLFGKYHQLVWQPAIVRGTKGGKPAPREVEVKV